MFATLRSRARECASTRALCALSLLSVVACDGPTLHAGSYLLQPDARADEDDDADEDRADAQVEEDSGRVRDAGRTDAGEWRYPFPEERHKCANNGQCGDNKWNRICDQTIDQCVECTNNQHCEPFGMRCNEMRGICLDPDRPRP